MIALAAAVSAVKAQAAPAAPAASTAAGAHFSTADTDIGTLLDDLAANAVLARNLPELVANEQISMARGMTLRAISSYASDTITDAKLATIDRDLAALPPHN